MVGKWKQDTSIPKRRIRVEDLKVGDVILVADAHACGRLSLPSGPRVAVVLDADKENQYYRVCFDGHPAKDWFLCEDEEIYLLRRVEASK